MANNPDVKAETYLQCFEKRLSLLNDDLSASLLRIANYLDDAFDRVHPISDEEAEGDVMAVSIGGHLSRVQHQIDRLSTLLGHLSREVSLVESI